MRWARLFGRGPAGATARGLYRRIVEQARQPGFFTGCGVPDTVDGRFEMIALHLFLLLHRLKAGRQEAPEESDILSQAVFDTMFEDMDQNLREMGAGDLSVGRKVKQMAEAVYGRIAAYERGLRGGGEILEDALRRNLYGTAAASPEQVTTMASYLRAEVETLAAQQQADILAGRVRFGPPPAA